MQHLHCFWASAAQDTLYADKPTDSPSDGYYSGMDIQSELLEIPTIENMFFGNPISQNPLLLIHC